VQALLRSLERQGVLDDDLRERLRQGYLSLFLDFYFSTPLRRDLDGGLKITQDALCEGLGLNDNRVVDIHLTKHIDPLHPHLYVELEAIPDWQFDKEYIVLT
jgi:crossover junction endodeoxyribonuclease RusA